MTSLIEDCQAWIDKGQESWKSYFSKWEIFAEYEETLPESELIPELSGKHKERRNGNQKVLKLALARKRLKKVFLKNQQIKQKKVIKKKKNCLKGEAKTRSSGSENLVEILENKQLEITLITVFSDILKANTNKHELFAAMFQTVTGGKMTVKDLGHLLSRQQLLPDSDFERRAANLSFENRRVLSMSKFRNSLNGRSICPPRDIYLQSLNENIQESNSEQIQSNLRQFQNPRVGTKNADNVRRNYFSKQQSSNSGGSHTPSLEKRSNLPYKPDLFGIENTKSIEFDSNHKFPKSFSQNEACIRSVTVSELSITQEGRRLGNLSLQHRTNRTSLSMDNTNFLTAQKKLSEHKCLSKMPPQKRHSLKKLIFDYKESDSDSDDQTKYRSPLILHHNKRLKADKQVADALEPDEDDCQHIFDRVIRS